VTADDHHWLRHLWAQHAGSVYAYAARRVGRERAEDVVADTFVVAWRHRERRPHRDLPWLLGVARRVIAERYRADGRWERLRARAALEGDGADPADATLVVAAWEVLAGLGESEREVLLLSAWEGLSGSEAGAVLGTSAAAYRMRLGRARRHLRRSMDEAGIADAGEDQP
jgi:RNA polymerase sigma-70 factor (ECF subfamily)